MVETCKTPALLTSTSNLPNASTAERTAFCASAARLTSHTTAMALPPDASMSSTTAWSFSKRRPATATLAPSRAKARAVPRPMPVPPPVIKTTLPASRVTKWRPPASKEEAFSPAKFYRGCANVALALLSSKLATDSWRLASCGRHDLGYRSGTLIPGESHRLMRIGITCYPTYGGSGVVATELGQELAARGHDIHFISYAPPIRMNLADPHIHFHEVEVASYPLFDHPPYTLALATKMVEVFESESLDLLHVHYAIPHSVSALLARSMAAPRRLPFITTLHGTDITLVGSNRSYLPITKFSIEQSDGVTAISQYLLDQTIKDFDIKRPIEVIPNFVNCDLYVRTPNEAQRAKWAPSGEPIVMHLSNFRPVKRVTDVVEIFSE